MLTPSAPIETKNDALEVPAPRRLDWAQIDHDYHCLANPNAWQPEAQHKANSHEHALCVQLTMMGDHVHWHYRDVPVGNCV